MQETKKGTDVVAALVVREGRLLICRRPAHKARGGLWEFVGGKPEKGESDEVALDRECREELGVGARTGSLYMEAEYDYPDLPVRLRLYRAELLGEPRALEHSALEWILPSEVGNYEFCPADEEIVARIGKGIL